MENLEAIDIYAQLGDLKDIDYRNTLAIATIIELLVEKGIISRHEFAQKAHNLDTITMDDIKSH